MAKNADIKPKSLLVDSDETLDKPIRIACQGAGTVELDELTEFQGNLKRLTDEAYQKLRLMILELGFSFPVQAWKHRNKIFILDAHQRVATLKRMRDEEGFQIPPLPVVWIEAANEKEAARKVLAATSQYGEVTPDGLHDFMGKFDIDITSMVGAFKFPEVNLEKFQLTYFPEPKTVSFEVTPKTPGDDIEEPESDEHNCPKCGYSWAK